MARVQDCVPLPVATGERIYSLDDFKQLCTSRAVAYLRPSIGLCGGFTGTMRLAALAQAFDIAIVPHNTLSPVTTMASLHLSAAIPNFLICEYPTSLYHDGIGSTELAGRSLVATAPGHIGGYVPLPQMPGLGVALADKICSRFPARTIDIAMRQRVDGSNVEH